MDYTIALPSKPRVIFEENNKGVYEIAGLYAGYGHTLGNSLRRIILSSIPGAAITSVKISGVPHEFTKIQGVKEDVITILLNLKRVRFKIDSDEPQAVKISANGISNVTSKDIEVPSQVKILNDQHIATLTAKDSKFEVEMIIEKGLGYVSREELKKDKVDIGTIVLDAAFTPIKKVNYEVENMRVGDRTDYNLLRISVETDGSVSPAEALQKSIDIMVKHLNAIAGFEENISLVEDQEEESAEAGKTKGEEDQNEEDMGDGDKEVLKTRIEDMELSARTLNILSTAGIRTLGGLARKKESDLLELEGVGKKMVQEIRRAMGNYGLTLK